MSLHEICFDFSSPLRVPSHRRDGLRMPMSVGADRLFSFIALGWSRLFGKESLKSQLIDPLLSFDYPIVISDLFPSVDGDLLIPSVLHANESSDLSRFFQAKWVPLQTLRSGLAGDFQCAEALQGATVCDAFQVGSISRSSAAVGASASRYSEQVSVLSFEGSKRALMTTASLDANRNKAPLLRLKGLLDIREERLLEPLKAVLAFMKDEGFGGRRSSGAGQIDSLLLSPVQDFDSQGNTSASSFLILSPACPSQKMLSAIQASPTSSNRYSISKAGGWIYDENGHHTGLKKTVTKFFETGSVFAVMPEGRLIDLSQEGHLCYRYGIPFVLPV